MPRPTFELGRVSSLALPGIALAVVGGSRLSQALAVALSALGVAGVGPAAAAAKDVCPTSSTAAGASTALSVGYPAGSVSVGASSARLNALIDTPAGQTSYAVVYGSSASYGLCTTAVPLPAAPDAQPVQLVLTGLAPQTTYHFSVVATSGSDSAFAADQTLTTLPAGELPQGTTINGVAVGGMNETAALHALRQLAAAPAQLALGKRRWSVARAQLGAEIAASSIAPALQGVPGQTLTVPTSVDTRRLENYLTKASRRYQQPARPGLLTLIGQHAVVAPAQAQVQIDTQRAQAAIAAYLKKEGSTLLRLPPRRTPEPSAPHQKAIVVRLSTQTLTAYLDGKAVLTTPVTTGRPALPTPIGSFYIHTRTSPYTFTSPWPKGNPYWYPPTPATWAMYFYDNDFLHDDPGEPASAFGAGSQNGPYASHGCVHVPHNAMAFLYQWLPIGATVIIARN